MLNEIMVEIIAGIILLGIPVIIYKLRNKLRKLGIRLKTKRIIKKNPLIDAYDVTSLDLPDLLSKKLNEDPSLAVEEMYKKVKDVICVLANTKWRKIIDVYVTGIIMAERRDFKRYVSPFLNFQKQIFINDDWEKYSQMDVVNKFLNARKKRLNPQYIRILFEEIEHGTIGKI